MSKQHLWGIVQQLHLLLRKSTHVTKGVLVALADLVRHTPWPARSGRMTALAVSAASDQTGTLLACEPRD